MKNVLSSTLLLLFIVACTNQQTQSKKVPAIDSSVESSVSLKEDLIKSIRI